MVWPPSRHTPRERRDLEGLAGHEPPEIVDVVEFRDVMLGVRCAVALLGHDEERFSRAGPVTDQVVELDILLVDLRGPVGPRLGGHGLRHSARA